MSKLLILGCNWEMTKKYFRFSSYLKNPVDQDQKTAAHKITNQVLIMANVYYRILVSKT